MPAPISFAKTDLSYPIFAAEFDPYARPYLIVGGGGGENKTGVPNKITVLNTSDRAQVSKVTELDLSREEDSPASLASLATKDGLVTYAGISSSQADKKLGKNEHLRSFSVTYPPQNKQTSEEEKKEASVQPLGKTCLFKTSNITAKGAYQPLLRLTPVQRRDTANKRLGAASTGLGPENEIIVFEATQGVPDSSSVCARIALGKGVEPDDLDIIEPYESAFALAYVANDTVCLHTLNHDFSSRTSAPNPPEPTNLYQIPRKSTGKGIPPPSRLRWISPHHILLLQNNGTTVDLIVLYMEKAGKKAQVTMRYPLPRAVRKAVAVDVCLLDADPATGERQVVVAIAADDSIYIYTLNHRPQYVDPAKKITSMKRFSHLPSVHDVSITKLVFSTFHPPRQPEGANMSVATPSQYIQLASGSMNGSLVVETLVLVSTPTSPSQTGNTSRRGTPNVRWVLSTPQSEIMHSWSGLVTIGFVIFITAVLLRSLLDVQGRDNVMSDTLSRVGAKMSQLGLPVPLFMGHGDGSNMIPKANIVQPGSDVVRDAVDNAQELTNAQANRLRDILNTQGQKGIELEGQTDRKSVLVHLTDGQSDEDISTSVHAEEHVEALKEQGAKHFEELTEAEKETWKHRLSKAGHWTAAEGESVLKGVLFSEYAAVVGGALRDAVLN